jgi:hypothetical protein
VSFDVVFGVFFLLAFIAGLFIAAFKDKYGGDE